MKKLFAILLALVLALSIVACNKNDEPQNTDTNNEEYSFTAKILEKSETWLLLEVSDTENSNILEGSQVSIAIKQDYPNLQVEDYVTVVFDGIALETYPLQLPNIYSVSKSSK